MADLMRSTLSALPLSITALVLVASTVCYFLAVCYQKRRMLNGLPQPPMRWKILGHIPIAADCAQHFPPDGHPQLYANYIRKKYNLGRIFYLDLWPLGPRQIFIGDPEISSQYVTTGRSLPKSYILIGFLDKLLGRNNMVSVEGEKWKSLRSIFNPGFASAHLMTLVPYIVDQCLIFCNVLREAAESGELIQMEEFATRLTVDIIGKVVLDSDFNSQRSENPILNTFRRHILLMPLSGVRWFANHNPVRNLKRFLSGRQLDRLIGEELDRKFSAAKSNGSTEKVSRKERKRSVVDLALEAYSKTSSNTKAASGMMDESFRQDSIVSIKTFIFAGHDTTSSTIAYVYYLLNQYPEVHTKTVAELDLVFGQHSDPKAIAEQIRENAYLVNKLDYMTAVIKETLRLFPPASTLRDVNNGGDRSLTITDPDTGIVCPLDGFVVWPIALLIHRNEDYFPKPVEFIPERFLQNQTPFPEAKLFTTAGKEAWRPFEKGPRSCIGQELAMIETKVILAMTLGVFDFAAEIGGLKVGKEEPCETVDEKSSTMWGKDVGTRGTVEGRRCYQMLQASAKPTEGMPGRVILR